MAGLNSIKLQIPATLSSDLPPEIWGPINDLYIALNNLVTQLNDGYPVMMSPNGHYWKAAISNAGVLTWSDVGTQRP